MRAETILLSLVGAFAGFLIGRLVYNWGRCKAYREILGDETYD